MLALTLMLLAATAVAADSPSPWPQQVVQDGNQMAVYQPQLDAWTNRVTFDGHVPVIVTPKTGTAAGGVLRISAQSDTDQEKRTVTLSNIQVSDAQFPSATAPDAAAMATLAKALLPKQGLVLSLDYLLAALAQSGQSAASVSLNTTPPQIFLAGQPSRLVLFDGAPSFATIPGTTVQHALNTNWALLSTTDAPGYFLLDSSGWLTSETLESGAWQYTDQLPPSFSKLPATKDWQDITSHIPPPPIEGQPPLQIYVSTVPAELIVLVGEPQYTQIPGTGLYAVQNTESMVFWDGYAKAFYYLTAGRWFRAASLEGPWTYATGSLPADFASIPADGPMSAVLASVPGTTEAREAALRTQIPQLATVSRKTAATTVTYDGGAQFAPIEGTALSYATNTPSDVVRVGDRYYLCQNGAWFTSDAANGPWSVASSVPDQIYAIPPSSPLYNVTYVRVYQTTDDDVVFGYTGGYLGEYVSDGVVTWGTGYYYPPYVTVGTTPFYYPRPYTYGCDAFYNPLNGTFHRAGYGYGPYGGVGAGSVYVPSTGAYARGATAYGLYDSATAVQAYNPRTGAAADGYRRSNPYATWDAGVVYGPERSARAASYSDGRGQVAAVQTADGATAVRVNNGDGSAAAVRAPDGDWYSGGTNAVRAPGVDWYAGGDNNLYRRADDGGWQRFASDVPAGGGIPGLGRPVDAGGYVPSRPAEPSRYVASNPAGPSRYVPSSGEWSGLNQNYAARQRAAQMDQRYANWGRGNFGGFGGGRYGGIARGGGGGRR